MSLADREADFTSPSAVTAPLWQAINVFRQVAASYDRTRANFKPFRS